MIQHISNHVVGTKAGRILFLTSCPEPWGGSEELWAGTAERMSSLGYEVFAGRSHGIDRGHPCVVRLAKSGIHVACYQLSMRVRLSRAVMNRVSDHLPVLARYFKGDPLLKKVKSLGVELAVISQGGVYDAINDGTNLVSLCEAAGLPYMLICQKASENTWPSDRNRSYVQNVFSKAKKIYFVSQHNKALTEQQLGRTLTNGEVVRNPFMVQTKHPLPWPEVTDGPFKIASIARLWVRDKGQDLLLSVLASEKWRQRPLEVHFYGKGDNGDALHEMASMLKLSNVRFCGFTQDVTKVWQQCHALILPSRAEGLPLVLVEAMICGRVGITTKVGGNAEMIDDGVTGFLAEAPTVEHIDEVLERAWNRRHEWKQMGLAASQEIWNRIPEDPCGVFAEKVAQVHADIVGSRRKISAALGKAIHGSTSATMVNSAN